MVHLAYALAAFVIISGGIFAGRAVRLFLEGGPST